MQQHGWMLLFHDNLIQADDEAARGCIGVSWNRYRVPRLIAHPIATESNQSPSKPFAASGIKIKQLDCFAALAKAKIRRVQIFPGPAGESGRDDDATNIGISTAQAGRHVVNTRTPDRTGAQRRTG